MMLDAFVDTFKFESCTIARAAQILKKYYNLSPANIRKLCRQGKVKARKESGRWIIDSLDWHEFVYEAPKARVRTPGPGIQEAL